MLKIKVNDGREFGVRSQTDGWYLDDQRFEGDIADLGHDRFHVLWRERSYTVEIVAHDPVSKTATLKINGRLITTTARNRLDELLDTLGMKQRPDVRINDLKAPMPGLIQRVAVQPGDHVEPGDTLLVLVAMKMENALKAPRAATVASVTVREGDTVEKNQLLIEFT